MTQIERSGTPWSRSKHVKARCVDGHVLNLLSLPSQKNGQFLLGLEWFDDRSKGQSSVYISFQIHIDQIQIPLSASIIFYLCDHSCMTTSYKSIMIQHDPPPFSAHILYLFFVPEGATLLPRVPNHLQVQPAKWYLGRNLLSMKNSSARNHWRSIQYTCYIFLLVYFPIILPNHTSQSIHIHLYSYSFFQI